VYLRQFGIVVASLLMNMQMESGFYVDLFDRANGWWF